MADLRVRCAREDYIEEEPNYEGTHLVHAEIRFPKSLTAEWLILGELSKALTGARIEDNENDAGIGFIAEPRVYEEDDNWMVEAELVLVGWYHFEEERTYQAGAATIEILDQHDVEKAAMSRLNVRA
jgi:hypothetical protein